LLIDLSPKFQKMKKYLSIFLFAICLVAQGVVARTVRLTFTGVSNSGYVRLDSVRVENLTRGWSETLLYPDTLLTLSQSEGLTQVQGGPMQMQVYPNPLRGKARVVVTAVKSEKAVLALYNLAGQCVARSEQWLAAGENMFDISLRNAGVCVLSVSTGSGNAVQKLLNRSNGGADAIAKCGVMPMDKLLSTNTFQITDTMRYTGYATIDRARVESRWVVNPRLLSGTVELVFSEGTQGTLKALFSVSRSKRVRFSQGNLQYSNIGTHAVMGDTVARGTWRFAEHQWDTLGHDNDNADSLYPGWIDLFAWGTSGYNAKYPYMRDTNPANYGNGRYSIEGTNYDWGVYNAISNGGDAPNLWRTLTIDEWRYVLDERPDALQKFSYAVIDGIGGVVLLPDYWEMPQGISFVPRSGSMNRYSVEQWTLLEKNGAVFLPANGFCTGPPIHTCQVNIMGDYWTSSRNVVSDPLSNNACEVNFSHHLINYMMISARFNGCNVRLVQDH
jgi:hypothetical protein